MAGSSGFATTRRGSSWSSPILRPASCGRSSSAANRFTPTFVWKSGRSSESIAVRDLAAGTESIPTRSRKEERRKQIIGRLRWTASRGIPARLNGVGFVFWTASVIYAVAAPGVSPASGRSAISRGDADRWLSPLPRPVTRGLSPRTASRCFFILVPFPAPGG